MKLKAMILIVLVSLSSFYFLTDNIAIEENPEAIETNNFVTPPESQIWGTSEYESVEAMTTDSSGNIYLCVERIIGTTMDEHLVLLKYSPTFDLEWSMNFTGVSVIIRDMTIDSSGNIYISGQADSPSQGRLVPLILKLDDTGTILWNETRETFPGSTIESIVLDDAENIIYLANYDVQGGIMVGKIDALTGKDLWNETYYVQDTELIPKAITMTVDDNLYVTGATLPLTGHQDIILLKMNSMGQYQANHTYAGPSDEDYGTTIAASSTHIYVGGYHGSYASDSTTDGFLAKYDFDCNLQWNESYDLSGTTDNGEVISALALTQSETVVFCGYIMSSTMAFTVEYDDSGVQLWNYTSDSENPGYFDLCLDASDTLFIGGEVTGLTTQEDALLMKFDKVIPQDDGGSGVDAGDNPNDAIPVSPGTISGGLPTGDIEDFYQFTANDGDLIEISLTADPSTDFDLWLNSPSQEQVDDSATFSYPETITYTANETGNWYVVVTKFSATGGNYTLTITVTPASTSSPPPTSTPPTTSTPSPTDSTTSGTEQGLSFLGLSWIIWSIIIGSGLVVTLLIIVVVVVSRKKKEKQ